MLKTLEIIDTLNYYGACSSATLETMHSVSVATLKRHVAEARLLGADIASGRVGSVWMFELKNGSVVMPLCTKWIDLERRRSLIP
jgi:hypothetical protein